MTVTFNELASMLFMAGIGATISFAILAFSKRGKRDMRFALFVQSTVSLGLGILFIWGHIGFASGLSASANTSRIFLVLALAHWAGDWRTRRATEWSLSPLMLDIQSGAAQRQKLKGGFCHWRRAKVMSAIGVGSGHGLAIIVTCQ